MIDSRLDDDHEEKIKDDGTIVSYLFYLIKT